MNPLSALSEAGVSIWLDDLSRDRLTSGSLATLVRGPARRRGHHQPRRSSPPRSPAATPTPPRSATWPPAAPASPRRCGSSPPPTCGRPATCCGRCTTRPTASTGGSRSRSTPGSPTTPRPPSREARVLWWLVDRPNLYIKIPATQQSLPAITACLAEGISVNVTLIFSLARYDEVLDAFLDGMLAAHRAGHDAVRDRVGGLVLRQPRRHRDRPAAGRDRHRGGRRAARRARRSRTPGSPTPHYERMIASPRWLALAAFGARPQRPLWASTSVKDPAYPDTRYVVDLVAPGVVNTMPEATLRAVADHGAIPADSIRAVLPERAAGPGRAGRRGHRLRRRRADPGGPGVTAFTASWDRLSRAAERRPARRSPPPPEGPLTMH